MSCLKQVDAVVGNSSSGLLEVPSFKKATINIGDRQKGRLFAKSVINCSNNSFDIQKSIRKIYTEKFKKDLKQTLNPYGTGGASKDIRLILESIKLGNDLKKPFSFDLNF